MKLVENSTWNLNINGKPAINELGVLEQKLADVRKAQSDLKRGTKEWTESQKEVKALEAEIKKVRETMGQAGMTVKQLEGYARQLNKEIKDLTPGTEEYIKKTAELQEVNTRLANVRKDTRAVADEVVKTKSVWSNMKDWITGALSAFTLYNILDAIVNFTRESLVMAAKFSDAFADIQKSTGMTAQEVKNLNAEIQKIDTRTAQESLLDIAKVGGSIGVANEQMLGFVKSTDMAVVALGDEFTGGAEEVAKVMGTLSKLFKETKDLEAGPAINQIGSAINELGAAGTATGPVVAEFTTRMGQLGNLSPQISQTLGLGAAFQELGLSAEISAGGLSNILLTASKDTATFADHLGMTEQKFKDLINTSPNEVILKLAASFRGMPIDEVVKRMDGLGIKSQEATKVMSLLSDQTDKVRQKQELASKAMKEGTSLTAEFGIKNNTAAAQLEKANKELDAQKLALGQALLPVLANATTAFVAFIRIIGAVPAFIRENKEMFIALGAAILGMNGTLIAATASSIAHSAAEKARAVWSQAVTTAQAIQKIATEALAAQDQKATLSSIAHAAAEKARALALGVVTGAKSALTAITTAFTIENIKATASSVAHSAVEKTRAVVTGTVTAAKAALTAVTTALTFENIRATAASVAYSVAEKARAIATNAVTVAQALLNAAMRANPIGLVITLVGGIVAAFVGWYNSSETLRAGMAGLWAAVKTVGTVIADVWGALTSLDFAKVSSILSDGARQVAASFTKGYQDQLKSESPKIVAQHQSTLDAKAAANKKHLDAKAIEEAKALAEQLEEEKSAKSKELAGKAAANEKHRKEQAEAAKKAAEQEAAEKVRAEKEALKAIEDAKIKAIADDQTREIAQLKLSHSRELERIAESKASQTTKAAWEKALTEQLERDIAAVEKTHRDKKLEEDKKRIEETRKLEQQQREEREIREFETTKLVLENRLNSEKLNISQRRALKLELIDLEHRMEIQRIEDVARAERQKAKETSDQLKKLAGDDAEKKKQIDADYAAASRAIDDKMLAEKAAANQQHQDQKKEAERKSLEERKANQDGFFNAIKAAMNGDFETFTSFLTKKLGNEKAMNDERLQTWTKKGVEILGVVQQSLELMRVANEKYLQIQIGNNEKERNDKIKKLQEQYKKGLIDKATYESGVNNINQQADAKEKELKLKAWKRDQAAQIAMAAINGAMAALKSLASLGWPLGLVGVAASAAITIAQIAMIKKQKPPTFAQGGKLRNAGVPDGPRHGSSYGKSGIGLVRRDTGEEVGEMEGGEPIMILSRNTYKNNRRVIDRLLHSSLHRNGAPIYARDGGLLFGRMYREGVYDDGSGDNVDQPYVDNFSGDAPANTNDGAMGNSYTDDYGYGYEGGGGDGGFDAGVDFGDGVVYEDGSSYTGDAAQTSSVTQAEIQKSQALMERIGKNTADTAQNTLNTQKAVNALSGQMTEMLSVLNSINGATNRGADNAGNAANASWAAASASNRAADAVAMSSKNDL